MPISWEESLSDEGLPKAQENQSGSSKKESSKGIAWETPLVEEATAAQPEQGAVSEIFSRRGQEFKDIARRELGGEGKPQQYPGHGSDIFSFLLQTVGKTGLGTLSDLIGAAGSAIVPEKVKETVTSGIDALAGTEAGASMLKAIQGGVTSYQEWAKNNPTLAANLEATTNIATAIPSTGISFISKNPLTRGIGNVATETNINRAREIIRPDRDIPGVAEERLRDTRQGGFLGELSIELNKSEERAAQRLGEVYDKSKTFTTNYNNARDFIQQESDALITKIDDATTSDIPQLDITRNVSQKADVLFKEKPTLKHARPLLKKIKSRYLSILRKYSKKGKVKPSDLLRVRREFDAWWQESLPQIDFKSTGGNPSEAELLVGLFRKSTNDTIDAAVPDANVKQELFDLSSMIRGNENVRLKAIAESTKGVQRVFDRIGINQPGTIPSIVAGSTIVAGSLYGASKALTSLSGIDAVLAGGGLTAGAVSLAAAIKIIKSPKTQRDFIKLAEELDKKKSFAASAALIESVNGLYTSLGEEPLFTEQKKEQQ